MTRTSSAWCSPPPDAVIGASSDDSPGFDSGSAYVFTRSGANWSFQQKITASDGTAGGLFGWSVDVENDRMLIGRPFADAAYAFSFDGNTWNETQKLTSTSAGFSPGFGRSLDLDGDKAVVGDMAENVFGVDNVGAAYLYRHNGTAWVLKDKLLPLPLAEGMNFAETLVVDGGDVVAGIPSNGKAYVYSAFVPYLDGCPGTGGELPTVSMSGRPETAGVVTVRIDNGLGGAASLLLVGTQAASIPASSICTLLVSPILATVPLVLSAGGPGAGSIAVSSALPAGLSGTTIRLQAVVQDAGSEVGISFTNGVAAEIF